MARFQLNIPVQTRESTVTVDNTLQVGAHTFQLIVEDDAGNRSAPARVIVNVTRRP